MIGSWKNHKELLKESRAKAVEKKNYILELSLFTVYSKKKMYDLRPLLMMSTSAPYKCVDPEYSNSEACLIRLTTISFSLISCQNMNTSIRWNHIQKSNNELLLCVLQYNNLQTCKGWSTKWYQNDQIITAHCSNSPKQKVVPVREF